MKEVIKKIYVAFDETKFINKIACQKYEKQLDYIKNIFAKLPQRPSDTDFETGKGYIQHNKQVFKKVERTFYKEACKYHKGLNKYEMNSHAFWATLEGEESPFYSDCFAVRLFCTSRKTWREYGQPYYAEHESEAKQIKLNT